MNVRTAITAYFIGFPGLALADPCTAPFPSPGTSFSGQVRYIGDGDSLCVGQSDNPATWIEVRLADFYAAELNSAGGREAKAALERITKAVEQLEKVRPSRGERAN